MRIISGKVCGLKLFSPDGEDTRPTLDKVKEAIFSIILPYIIDSDVLDLFSGSGALGIEALSRGASSAVFVDVSSESINCIKKNITASRFENASCVEHCDSLDYLRSSKKTFDIIFIDPPYTKNMYEPALSLIAENGILNSDGIIVLEYDYSLNKPQIPEAFEIIRDKKYGRVGVLVLKISAC